MQRHKIIDKPNSCYGFDHVGKFCDVWYLMKQKYPHIKGIASATLNKKFCGSLLQIWNFEGKILCWNKHEKNLDVNFVPEWQTTMDWMQVLMLAWHESVINTIKPKILHILHHDRWEINSVFIVDLNHQSKLLWNEKFSNITADYQKILLEIGVRIDWHCNTRWIWTWWT